MNEEFFLSFDHIALLQHAVIRWEDCEFGAPAIDCKRPYGNSSVYYDMCEILGIPFGQMDKDKLRKLHEETETALQIILETGHMSPGTYTRINYKWYQQSAVVKA